VSANSEWLDQFEEGNATGGYASKVEALRRPAVSPSMTPRRFPAPWRADKVSGGHVVRDANGQALAYVYCRDNEAEARQAKVLTTDEARRTPSTSRELRVRWKASRLGTQRSMRSRHVRSLRGNSCGNRFRRNLLCAFLRSGCVPFGHAIAADHGASLPLVRRRTGRARLLSNDVESAPY
jgi:hypothetical protein